jgi:NNP family nitrate/nitrite transporter-like MFS transporter
LIVCGFFIGVALASFSVGVGFVNGWYPPEKQGAALGVYGAGNIGQSLAAFGSPLLAAALGFRWGFWTFGVLLLAWLAVFLLKAENAPRRARAKRFSDVIKPLSDTRSWVLSLYYFLTFGGFVAMAIYLPIFLPDTGRTNLWRIHDPIEGQRWLVDRHRSVLRVLSGADRRRRL